MTNGALHLSVFTLRAAVAMALTVKREGAGGRAWPALQSHSCGSTLGFLSGIQQENEVSAAAEKGRGDSRSHRLPAHPLVFPSCLENSEKRAKAHQSIAGERPEKSDHANAHAQVRTSSGGGGEGRIEGHPIRGRRPPSAEEKDALHTEEGKPPTQAIQHGSRAEENGGGGGAERKA